MSERLEKLLDQLVNLHPKYIDLSLERLLKLLEKLENPHLKLPPTIHIAGTNGKGSTLTYIYNILKKNEYKVHCYISPHLKSIKERFIVSNKIVETKKLLKTFEYVKKINNNNPITFFEITTAASFYIFSKTKADFLILETGLGGRLDATNVIKKSIIDIITPISYDHQEFLGNNILKIANEKLGIIKPNSKIIIGKQNTLVKKHIKNILKNNSNKKYFYGDEFKIIGKKKSYFSMSYKKLHFNIKNPKLRGGHQIENACIAICASLTLRKLNYKIKKKSIDDGIHETFWPGRLEKGNLENIDVFLDGAHNIEGSKQIVKFFNNNKRKRWIIIGMLNNKDLKSFLLNIKKIVNGVIAIKIPNEKNSFSTKKIYETCKKYKIECVRKNNILEANNYLINKIKPKEVIITGSLYLVGKVRNLYI